MELTAVVETVTPELAEKYLTNNPMNRQLHHSQIRLYSRLMREGKWKLIPAPLCFSKEDMLLQGQHRLSAVVDSGTTHDFLVCRGIDKEIFPLLDAGLTRSGSDALFIQGNFSHPELYASLVYNIIRWNAGAFWGHGNKAVSPSSVETLEYALENKAELSKTVNFMKSVQGRTKYMSERFFVASMHIIKETTSDLEVKIHAFFLEICSEKETADPAVDWLRDSLMVDKQSNSKLQRSTVFAMIFYAWNGYQQKKFIGLNPDVMRDVDPI